MATRARSDRRMPTRCRRSHGPSNRRDRGAWGTRPGTRYTSREYRHGADAPAGPLWQIVTFPMPPLFPADATPLIATRHGWNCDTQGALDPGADCGAHRSVPLSPVEAWPLPTFPRSTPFLCSRLSAARPVGAGVESRLFVLRLLPVRGDGRSRIFVRSFGPPRAAQAPATGAGESAVGATGDAPLCGALMRQCRGGPP